MKSHILIADSGSTKTDWLVTGSKIQFQSAGLNPFYQTNQEVIKVLKEEVLPKLTTTVDQIFFYGAGCADEITSKPIFEALKACITTADKINVASDMLGAARGLCGREPGIACILGTGANNAFYDGQNIVRSIGSLGFWLGDEGSGSYLGKTLIVSFLQNELPLDLNKKFSGIFPKINRLSVLDQAYKKPFPNRYFASFSKFIAENIEHPFLKNLVETAFGLFLDKYVLKHENVENYPIHFTGSIAYYYQDLLKISVAKKGLIVGRILKSPLEGLVVYNS